MRHPKLVGVQRSMSPGNRHQRLRHLCVLVLRREEFLQRRRLWAILGALAAVPRGVGVQSHEHCLRLEGFVGVQGVGVQDTRGPEFRAWGR